MLDFLQSIWGSYWIAISGFLVVCKIFETYEKVIHKDKLQKISQNILNFKFSGGARKVIALWVNINNSLFGHKIISLRSFIVSTILTNAWCSVFILTFCVTYPSFRNWLGNIAYAPNLHGPAIKIYLCIILIEFASLSFTRKVYRMSLSKGNRFFGWALAIDLLGSIGLYYLGLTLAKFALLNQAPLPLIDDLLIWLDPANLSSLLQVTEDFDMRNFKPSGDGTYTTDIPLKTVVVYAFPEGVFFFTSILTSVWLWGYIMSYALGYLCVRIDRTSPYIKSYFRIEEQPLLFLSVLFGTIGVVGFVLMAVAKSLIAS